MKCRGILRAWERLENNLQLVRNPERKENFDDLTINGKILRILRI
jgi:hypothetical protein